jgi:hypothetical protein
VYNVRPLKNAAAKRSSLRINLRAVAIMAGIAAAAAAAAAERDRADHDV